MGACETDRQGGPADICGGAVVAAVREATGIDDGS
jgi:hypothetical protein